MSQLPSSSSKYKINLIDVIGVFLLASTFLGAGLLYLRSSENGEVKIMPVETEVKGESVEIPKKKININTASQAELEKLEGIGPSLAQRIIDHRESNGKFQSIEAIKNVSGVGEGKFQAIADQIEAL